jgi:hypothetical protein
MKRIARFVVPVAPAPDEGTKAGRRGFDGASIRLGLLDNNKGNADHLLAMLRERIAPALSIESILAVKKPTAVLGAPAAMLDQLAKEANCVVGAMAD